MKSLSVPCQFLMTLSVLPKGFHYNEFADIYCIPSGGDVVSNVFKTWLYFMYNKFGDYEWRKTLFVRTKDLPFPPKVFQNDYLKKIWIVIGKRNLKFIISSLDGALTK